ncbi:hypothetical protein COT77_02615 [Candidatus Berkelbacteria bacterium CG10_big_fil_rev_8_21_14_0_10_41_12]|uniref:Uncharacterized protein n=1 Tax=Candidatus Berkelbacteria bacterium CG10_big_fil_rev_8_21_14_0_10_41_12 TaxID=1974513 RepID=A0A2M6WWS1_9BACT|nr:MAG: hypothetical protein COT77_02615 [Candidatus Berkelbacteria bacterium CG10_big_fil_rev_8_21_14_0_10_41_12]
MIKLSTSDKTLGSFSEIDKFAIIPKKLWDDFPAGKKMINIRGKNREVEVYEILCDCMGKEKKHNHRIIDLRELWKELDLKNKTKIEIK